MVMPKKIKKAKDDGTFFKQSQNDEIFGLVKDPKTEKVRIVIGQNVVSSKTFDDFEKADEYITAKPYELIINSSCLFMTLTQNLNNNENKNKEV